MIDQGIGALSEGDRRLGDESSRVVLTTPGQQLCPKRSPGNRCLECMAGKSLTLHAQFLGLVVPVEREARAAQQRCGLGGVSIQSHPTKTVVGLP